MLSSESGHASASLDDGNIGMDSDRSRTKTDFPSVLSVSAPELHTLRVPMVVLFREVFLLSLV